ncbi:unnamed protein product [Allacma fusca]|uniref:WD repeat-containing protein 55 homolog n=1 Tax=Allacma fusca TaxID=39272 RepID=A0A8J2KFJ6_9HEXA|nr:unnamed protein product [Allacma fusca]
MLNICGIGRHWVVNQMTCGGKSYHAVSLKLRAKRLKLSFKESEWLCDCRSKKNYRNSQIMSESEDSSSFDDDSSGSSSDSQNEEEETQDVEDDGDDDVIKALKLAQMKKKAIRPPDIALDNVPCNFSFHPVEDLIVVSDYKGNTELYSYSNEANEKLKAVQHKDANTRDLKFNKKGDKLCALLNNKDLVLYHTDGLQVERTIKDSSEETGICLHVVDENILVVGDEDGHVQAWDKRMQGTAFSFKVAEDAISALISDEEGKVLVASSTEGTLSSIKVRAKKIQTQSEPYETDFNCMGVIKQNTKLAVGDSAGKVYLFNWGEYGYHSDVYPGHLDAVNCMIPITEKIIITGGDDGYLRAVHFYPMKFLGIVGKHKLAVESMDVCNDGHLIASISHDAILNFWNVSYFEDFIMPAEVKTSSKSTKSKDMKHNLPSSRQGNKSDFFQGLKE